MNKTLRDRLASLDPRVQEALPPVLARAAKSDVKTVATAAQLQKWADKVGDLMKEVHAVHTKANDPKEAKLLSAITTALNTIDTTLDKINDL